MHAFRVPGIDASLCYHDLPGREPVVVYLNGLGGAASEAFPAIARAPVLARYRGLLIDLLGFGYSDRPTDFGYTIEDHAECVAALLDHLSVRRCSVLGQSMGGSVAIVLASRRPDLVG